jgi:hypothetical protein
LLHMWPSSDFYFKIITDFYIIDMFEQLNNFEIIQIANVYQIRINRTIY